MYRAFLMALLNKYKAKTGKILLVMMFGGEVKNHSTSGGFPNWLHFYFKEQKGTLDYHGYIQPCSNPEA
jgi:hypothetical protein